MPDEDDTAAPAGASVEGPTPNLFSSNVLAFAGGSSVDAIRRTPLGPRAPVQAVRVWIGLNPPGAAELAAQAAEEDAAAKPAKKGQKSARKPADDATGSKLGLPKGAIEEKGKNGRASVSLKPVAAKDKAESKDKAGPLKIAPDGKKPAKPAVKAEAPAKSSKAN
jgi:D-alanyl-D-alanine carboxypeptidase